MRDHVLFLLFLLLLLSFHFSKGKEKRVRGSSGGLYLAQDIVAMMAESREKKKKGSARMH
jgi:hypothetical protein